MERISARIGRARWARDVEGANPIRMAGAFLGLESGRRELRIDSRRIYEGTVGLRPGSALSPEVRQDIVAFLGNQDITRLHSRFHGSVNLQSVVDGLLAASLVAIARNTAGEIVGFADMNPSEIDQDHGTIHTQELAFITDGRMKGAGKALVDAMILAQKKSDQLVISLVVNPANEAASKLRGYIVKRYAKRKRATLIEDRDDHQNTYIIRLKR